MSRPSDIIVSRALTSDVSADTAGLHWRSLEHKEQARIRVKDRREDLVAGTFGEFRDSTVCLVTALVDYESYGAVGSWISADTGVLIPELHMARAYDREYLRLCDRDPDTTGPIKEALNPPKGDPRMLEAALRVIEAIPVEGE